MSVMTKKKTKTILRFLLVAAIIAVCFGIWYMTRAKSSTPKATTPSTSTESSSKSTTTKPATQNNDNGVTDKGQPPQSDSNQSTELSITISRPVNNDLFSLNNGVQVRSVINGASSANCTLLMNGPGGAVINKTASMVMQTSYGSCSFNISSRDLTVGDWSIKLSAVSGNSTASDSKTIKVAQQ